ncbi:discoidin domain-containing protein, partial [Lentilitoribacter sp. EG35]|uniref:discoidin domain-containing protein n=1 Tax=Lentilitoribacter sp. EG35 TaxID=3234192 RepID=UPI00345FC598
TVRVVAGSNDIAIAEINVYGEDVAPDTFNLVNLTDLYKEHMFASASSTRNTTYLVENVLDDDTNTSFESSGTSGQWLQLDLGANLDISIVEIVDTNSDGRLNGAKVVYLNAAGQEITHPETIITGVVANEALRFNYTGSEKVHFIKIEGADGYALQIAEINVYGEDVAPDTFNLVNLTDLYKEHMFASASTYSVSGAGVPISAERTLDDDNSTNFQASSSGDEWYKLDLGADLDVSIIEISNRSTSHAVTQFNGAKIMLLGADNDPNNPIETFVVSGAEDSEVMRFHYDGLEKARYVHIQSNGNYHLTFAEINVYGEDVAPDTFNLVNLTDLYKEHMFASASSSYTDGVYAIDHALDNDLDTSFLGLSTPEKWFELDLGAELNISIIEVTNRVGDYPYVMDGTLISLLDANGQAIQISEDNGVPVYHFDPITGAESGETFRFIYNGSEKVRTVRVEATNVHQVVLAEINVYGEDVAPDTFNLVNLTDLYKEHMFASASSSYTDGVYAIDHALDNDLDTSFLGLSTPEKWFELDLGAELNISIIEVTNRVGDYPYVMDGTLISLLDANGQAIQISEDNGVPVYHFDPITGAESGETFRFIYNGSEKVRTVRVEATNVHQVVLAEINVYGEDVENENVFLKGTAGDDVLIGSDGDDYLDGGAGDDSLSGGAGNDTIVIDDDDTSYSGDAGIDTLVYEGTQNKQYDLEGSTFENIIFGAGDDFIWGTGDANNIAAGDGNDNLDGRSGDDFLDGGAGQDEITGGDGNDTFVFTANMGNDVITDFVTGLNSDDVIEIRGLLSFDTYAEVLAAAADDGTNTTITIDADNSITLNNVVVADLHQDDFRFA